MAKECILQAKKKLYLLLTQTSEENITENEVDIMFLLAKDKQIQEVFEKSKKKDGNM